MGDTWVRPLFICIEWLLILAASCFVGSNAVCLAFTFGTFYLPLLDKFNEGRATTATVQSTLIGVMSSTGIIWGLLCRKFGLGKTMFVGSVLVPLGFITSFFAKSLNQLIFCVGIVSGIGTSIVFVCNSAAVAMAFENNGVGIAIAVNNCAVGIGTATYPFLLDYFLHKYNLSGTFLLLGGLNLNNLVVAQLYYNNLEVENKLKNRQEKLTLACNTNFWKQLITTFVDAIEYIRHILSSIMSFRFGIFIFAVGISVGCLNGFVIVVLDVFACKNFTNKEGLYSFTAYNACSILGRLLPVLFQLKNDVHPMILFILCSLFGCVGQLLMLQESSVWLMYIGRGLSGIAVGGFISGGSVALLHFVHKDMFSAAFGLMITPRGVVTSTAGPLYGWMRDELQSYDAVIALMCGVLGFSALLFFIDLCVTKAKTAPDEISEEVHVQPEVHVRY